MTKALQEGDIAPSFSMPTDRGEISSGTLNGQPYVLYFYPRDDTSGCTKEAIAFSEREGDFSRLGVAVIGVSKDNAASHAKFRSKYDLNIELAADVEKETAQKYGVWGEKRLYGRSYMGMERATFLVDGAGVIRKIWRKVKVPGHAEAVLQMARELCAAKGTKRPKP